MRYLLHIFLPSVLLAGQSVALTLGLAPTVPPRPCLLPSP